MVENGVIGVGDTKDEDSAIVNIDDILTTVYQQGEVDWYRQALLELNAQVFEYDFKRDNMIIFDTPTKENGSNLAKMEIPNYLYNVSIGRIVHSKDVKRYQTVFNGNQEFKVIYRRFMINHGSGYTWVKDTGRIIYDEDNKPKICIGVSRVISDEKLNEQMMNVLSVMEQSTDFDSSINHILAEIGDDFLLDRITLLLEEGNNYRSVYAWQDESIELEISDTFPIVRTELQEIVTYFKEHQIIVVNKNEGNQFSKQINKNFFDNQVKTLVIISLNDDIGEFIGCIVFTMINDYRQWRDDELWALQELVKGINVYLNKEKIFNRLDSILLTYNRVMEKLNDGILMFTYESQPQLLFINEAYRKILNIDDINVTNFLSTYYRSVDLDVQKQIHQAIEKCVETGEEQTLYHPLKTCEKQIIKAKTIYNLSPVKENGKLVIISITTKQCT